MRHNTTLTYLSVLCITDFLSMMPLPMTILDQVTIYLIIYLFKYLNSDSRLLDLRLVRVQVIPIVGAY